MPELLATLDAFMQEHRRCGETGRGYVSTEAERAVCSLTVLLSRPMPGTLEALVAFVAEHRHCGEMDGGVDGEQVWMSCDCGGEIAHPIWPAEPLDEPDE